MSTQPIESMTKPEKYSTPAVKSKPTTKSWNLHEPKPWVGLPLPIKFQPRWLWDHAWGSPACTWTWFWTPG